MAPLYNDGMKYLIKNLISGAAAVVIFRPGSLRSQAEYNHQMAEEQALSKGIAVLAAIDQMYNQRLVGILVFAAMWLAAMLYTALNTAAATFLAAVAPLLLMVFITFVIQWASSRINK